HMPIAATTNLFTGNLLDLAWHTFDTPHSTGKNDGDDEVVALLAACSYDGTVALLEFTKNELGTPIPMHEQEQMLVKYGWTPRSSAKRRLAIVDSDDDDDSDDGARAKRPRPIAETVTQLQLEEQAAQTEQPEQPMPVQTAQTTQIAQTETKQAQQALPVQMPVPIRTKDGKKRVAPVFIRALGSSSSSSTNSSSTNAVAVAAAPAAAVPATTVTTIVAPAPTDSEPVAAPAWIEARVLGTRILSSSPAPAHSISVISHAVTPLAPQSLVHAQTISAARVHLNVPKIVAHISRSVSDADSLTLVATNQGTSKPQLTCSGTPNANAGNDGSGGGSQHSDPLWTKFFDAPIVALAASNALTAASLADGSLHFLDTQSGARLLAPLIAEAHPSHIACRDHFCLVLDSVGQLSVWDLARTSAVLTNISVAPLLYSAELACKTPSPTNSDPPHRHPPKVAITKIDLAPDASPIISLSDGRAFSFHRSLRAWLRIADPASYRGSDFATLTTPSRVLQKLSDANRELAAISPASSSSSSSMPLARLQELGAYQLQATTALNPPSTKSKASSSHAQQQNTARLPSEVRRSVTVDHAEHQLVAAEFLQSSDEVIKWCDVLMRQLAKIGDTKRAAYWLAYLLGPPLKTDDNAAGGGSAWKPEIAAVSKHQLLKRALPILSANRHLQSLVAEYSTALC
ncbi:HIR complex subunit, partial [Linderina macrospora]